MDAIQQAKEAADAAYRQQQYETAIKNYGNAINASEHHLIPDLLHVLYSNRAAAKLAIKDYQGALADAQASTAVNEKWVKGWYRSAKALQGLGNYEYAIQAATRALQLAPANKEAQALLGVLKRYSHDSSSTTANSSAAASSRSQEAGTPSHIGQEDTTLPGSEQQQQQQQQQQQLPWQQLCVLRRSLSFQALPPQLLVGSEYIPSADGVNQNLLLLLHGLGDKPAPFTALARRMALPQTASLALSGPLPVPEADGGRAWFTAYDDDWELIKPSPGEKRRVESLASTLALLQHQLLPGLAAAGGWQPEQIQLLGFSQGGSVVLELARACKGDQRLGGAVAVSASLLQETLQQPSCGSGSTSSTAAAGNSNTSGSSRATDVLIPHGDRDDVVPRDLVNRTVALLEQSGCDVTLHTLPSKGHGMISSAAEMQACMAFWAPRLRSRPADASYVEVPRAAAAAVVAGL